MDRLDESFSSLIDYTSRNMRRFATGHLRQLGLTIDQWAVLKLLEEDGGSADFGHLSDRLLRDKATITRILDLLEERNLVARSPDSGDRRRVRVMLTRPGRQKVEKAAEIVAALRATVSAGLTESEKSALGRTLKKLNRNIEVARDQTA